MPKEQTYYDLLLEILSHDIKNKMKVNEIMDKLDLRYTKTVYVIDAIKKGIKQGTILKHDNPESKTLYKDHYYTLN